MLEHLRVLDLADERGLLCGRLLADLGADVVQVEPLDGSPARERALYWETFAAGRRGIALDLDGDLSVLRDLAARADILVTSWDTAFLRDRGLDADTLCAGNPRLVYTSVTAFGRTGPKAGYADCDLVVWAAGGPLDPHRDGDRPPLRISVPQAYLHASADAAAGALIAVLARHATGRGQVVDVSAQASVGLATLSRVLADPVGDDHPEWHPLPRTDQSGSGAATPNSMKKWSCRDGLVELHLSMGPAAGTFTNNLFGWLRAEGAVTDDIAAWDWRALPDQLSTSDIERARAAVRAFLLTKTKAEVLDAAIKHRLLCMAIYDVADVYHSAHLAERHFWSTVDINGVEVRIPGRIAHVTDGPQPTVRRPAPRLGEHDPAAVLTSWTPPRPSPVAAPVSELKVLDLSWVVAGPLIGRALADFGATVVRVESSTRPETARLMQPFYGGVAGPENSALYGNCNAGKLGLTVDLKSDRGRALVRKLAAWADVVVESFSPGQLARWGLSYRELSAANPALVMVSTSIAGQTGPWSALAGFGNVGSSLSGFQHLVGWPDRVPTGPFGPYTDYLGPRLALATLLAALEHCGRTGKGMHIDVAQVEAGVFFLSPQVAHYGLDGTVATRRGNDDEVHHPHGVYPCRDGRYVAIAARTDVERAMLPEDLTAWTSARDASAVERELQALGVPAHVSASSADVTRDPQLAHRGHLVALPHERHGTAYVEGPRYLLSDTPGRVTRPAPMLGQDTDTVLATILGYDETTIRDLYEGGVLR